MKIRFQCENEIFMPLLAKVKLALADKNLELCGYKGNSKLTEADSVYQQLEAVYMALQREALPHSNWLGSISELEKIFLEEEVLLTPSLENGNLLDVASYVCALLTEAGLHPVLIFGEDKIAAGVWLYDDYDMETCKICNLEFIQEAYDEGGCVLAFDCAYLVQHKQFGDAIEAGCTIVKNFIFAVDISFGNAELEGEAVLLSDGVPLYHFEDDGSCSYFRQLLQLYTEVSADEEMASSIMSDEVQHKQWASCFIEGVEGVTLETVKPVNYGMHLLSVGTSIQKTVEYMNPAQLLLVKTEPKERELLIADVILQNLQANKKTLLLSSEKTWNAIGSPLENTKLCHAILTSEQLTDGNCLRNQIDIRNQEEFNVEQTRRLKVQQKRYQDARHKVEQYNEQLEAMTGCGQTLEMLFEGWNDTKHCPLEIEVSKEQVQDMSSLEMVRQYTDALYDCQQFNENGVMYLDFSRFSPEEIKEIIELLNACNMPFNDLLQLMLKLGAALGREHIEGEPIKVYMEIIQECVDNLQICEDLWMHFVDSQELAVPDGKQLAKKESYEHYIEKEQAKDVLRLYWDVDQWYGMDDVTVKRIVENSQIVQEELGIGGLKNRACEVALKDLETDLATTAKTDKFWKHLRRAQTNQICSSLQVYFQSDCSESDMILYERLSELFGQKIYDNAILFSMQLDLAQYFEKLIAEYGRKNRLIECMKRAIQSTVTEINLDAEIRSWYELANQIDVELRDYSKKVKTVFRYVGVDYRKFAEEYPDDSLMKFIDDWEDLLIERKVYDVYQQEKMTLLRNHLGSVQEQFANQRVSARLLYAGFEKAWYGANREYYGQSFDVQDYSMNISSCENLCKELYASDIKQLENKLLKQSHEVYEELNEQIQDVEIPEIFQKAGTLLQQYYPIMCMSPQQALTILKDTDVEYDQIIICNSEQIPYYQILYLSTKGDTLLMLSEDGNVQSGSVAYQAQQKGFPVLMNVEGENNNE